MDGQKLYFLRQEMGMLSSSTASVWSIANSMIKRGIVSVKILQVPGYAKKNGGVGKPDVPVF